MEASAGLVAGSHNRNELVVIRRDGEPGVRTHSRCQFPRLLAGVVLISGSYCSPSRWTGRTGGRARFAATTWASPPAASPSWRATSAPSQSAATATSTSGARARRAARSARPGSSASRASPPPFRRLVSRSHSFFFAPRGGLVCCRVRACSGGRGRGGRRRPGGRVQLEGQRPRLPVRRRVHAPRAHELRPRRRPRRRVPAHPERSPPHQRTGGMAKLTHTATHIAPLRRLFRPMIYQLLARASTQVDDIPPEQHALVPSFMGGGGKRIHPLPYADPNLPGASLICSCTVSPPCLEYGPLNALLVAGSATEVYGPVQGSRRVWLRERRVEGEDGGLEAEAGEDAPDEE
jgi:hypothetical protein